MFVLKTMFGISCGVFKASFKASRGFRDVQLVTAMTLTVNVHTLQLFQCFQYFTLIYMMHQHIHFIVPCGIQLNIYLYMYFE